jgi:hypothetical protein
MKEIQKEYVDFYHQYINSLPLTDFVKNTLMGSSANSKDSEFYLFYPRLFSESFNIQDSQDLKLLCVAGYLYYQSIINLDQSFDSKAKSINLRNMFIISICQEESLKILGHLFSPNSDFWKCWGVRKIHHYDGIEAEKLRRVYKESDYYNLACNKSSFGKVAIDALHFLSDEKYGRNHSLLLEAHNYFSIANQLVDDVQDISLDLEQGQFNWVYEQLVRSFRKSGKTEIDPLQIKQYLYSTNLGISFYKKASTFFSRAMSTSKETNAVMWLNTLKSLQIKNEYRIDTLFGFNKIAKIKTNIKLKSQKRLNSTLINIPSIVKGKINFTQSIKFILSDQINDYAEAKHIMYLSKMQGFSSSKSIQIGDVFQRAIISDLFCDLSANQHIDLTKFINENVHYLIAKRIKDEIGGWSYFPTFNGIGADIDDLGQVLQLLVKAKQYSLIEKYCAKVIDFAILNCSCENGGIKTCILPSIATNEKQRLQKIYIESKWGEGPDVEVVANFIYSLALYNSIKYESTILRGCSFLETGQTAIGSWQSRWYYGDYYGTYVCTRMLLFDSPKKHKRSLKKATDFLVESQNLDGGWGLVDKNSDPLNTAFGLMALKNFGKSQSILLAQKKSRNYLLSNIGSDGSWPAVNFIKPRINDPYRSKTITTAYALKALMT